MKIKEPNMLGKPWSLSRFDEEPRVEIPTNVTKLMKNYQILPVEFLYHNLRKGRTGVILNQDDGMDFPLQIAAFFRAILKMQSLVLVLCPDYLIADWHYNLSIHGNCDVIVVQNGKSLNSKLASSKKNGKNQALVLGLTELKLADDLVDLDLFSVVVQNFDEIANKRILRHLKGNFNIGLSTRSFYKHPDQKLQWTMLDWANPGCVGKLKDFYEYDNRNFSKYLDNYRIWWQRLTWGFCDSFKTPTEAEKKTLENYVKFWAKKHNLSAPLENKIKKSKSLTVIRAERSPSVMPNTDDARKRKSLADMRAEPSSSKMPKTDNPRKHKSLTDIRPEPSSSKIPKTDDPQPSTSKSTPVVPDESSSDTVEYDPSETNVELPSVDENPILTSIVRNFELIESPAPNPPTATRSEDFLIGLVNSNPTESGFHRPTDLNGEIDRTLAEIEELLDD